MYIFQLPTSHLGVIQKLRGPIFVLFWPPTYHRGPLEAENPFGLFYYIIITFFSNEFQKNSKRIQKNL